MVSCRWQFLVVVTGVVLAHEDGVAAGPDPPFDSHPSQTSCVARDVRTGEQQWAAAIPEVQSPPVWLRQLPNGTALVSNGSGVFVALRP
jgi:hypothetical protein